MRTRVLVSWLGGVALTAAWAGALAVGCTDDANTGGGAPDASVTATPTAAPTTPPPVGAEAGPDGPDVVEFDAGFSDAAADGSEPPPPDAAPDAPPPETGCAVGATPQSFGGGLWGCAGKVEYPSRDALCNNRIKCQAASAAAWERQRGGQVPAYHYWVDTPLGYGGTGPGACWVGAIGNGGITDCGATTPMRVCAPPAVVGQVSTDGLGNVCNWTACTANQNGAANHYGGCSNNLTAGTLCLCP